MQASSSTYQFIYNFGTFDSITYFSNILAVLFFAFSQIQYMVLIDFLFESFVISVKSGRFTVALQEFVSSMGKAMRK